MPSRNAKVVLLLLAAAVGAVAARLLIAAREPLWYDECLTLAVADLPWSGWWRGYLATESSPPLFFLIVRIVAGFLDLGDPSGAGWKLALRLPSVLAPGLAVWVLGRAMQRHFGATAAVAMGLYLAVTPFLLWYGAEARPYSLWTLCLTGQLAALLDLCFARGRSLDDPALRPVGAAVRYAGWNALALATHYFAVFPIAVAGTVWAWYLLRHSERTPSAWQHWIGAHVVVASAALALAPLVRAQSEFGHTAYIPEAGLRDLVRTFFVVFPFGLDAALFPAVRWLGAVAVLFVLGLALTPRRSFEKRSIEFPSAEESAGPRIVLLVLFIAPVMLLFLFSAAVRPVFLYDRYTIMSLPAWAALVGWCAAEASHGWRINARRVMAGLSVCVLFGCALLQLVRYNLPDDGALRYNWNLLAPKLRDAGIEPRAAAFYIPEPVYALPFRVNTEGVGAGQVHQTLEPALERLRAGRKVVVLAERENALRLIEEVEGSTIRALFEEADFTVWLVVLAPASEAP